MTLSEELKRILACPLCKKPVTAIVHKEQEGLLCPSCRLLYPVTDDIPVMLAAFAVPFEGPLQEPGD
ncbi:MAG: Trm112 family protein [Candidatus Eremiobacteraeota bacterium]|nr:Trm112 family protein [Candidatus Eremiobacteraeota bacterium]